MKNIIRIVFLVVGISIILLAICIRSPIWMIGIGIILLTILTVKD